LDYFFFPFTRFLRAAPALNLGLLEAAILISFPVWGLRPILAALLATSKVPNPMSWIFPPFLSYLATTSVKALIVASVSFLESFVSFAIASINSVLFIDSSL